MRTIFTIAAFVFVSWMIILASCKKSPPLNKPPIAIAGPDQVITAPINSVSLNGTASWDSDGKISEWLWTKISGPAHAFSNATAGATVVNNLVEGVYQLELKVTDDKGLSAKDTMQITVNQPNRPPIANAGPDIVRSCNIYSPVILDGRGSSDPDNNTLNYQWKQISGPPLSNSPNFTVPFFQLYPNLVVGQYVFELKVSDAGGLSSKDTMLLNIIAPEYKEYNLDVIIDGRFTFLDNVKDCYYTPCSYYDLTTITGNFNFQPIGQFDFYTSEYSDTAFSGNVQDGTYMNLSTSSGGPYVYGKSSINFKQLIQKGGGSFSGTLKVEGGSASVCGQNVYADLPPLTVTGNMDTTAHTVKLNIKGKIYF